MYNSDMKGDGPDFSDLRAALMEHARERPHALALRFLPSGDADDGAIERSFSAFCNNALAIAAALQRETSPGARALLLYDGGVDFIEALYGCFFAGVIGIPTSPPDPRRLDRTLPHLEAICADAEPEVALGPRELFRAAESLGLADSALGRFSWLSADEASMRGADYQPHRGSPDDVAYLQYTSGSTGSPKGVVVSHANLRIACQDLYARFPYQPSSHHITWLPTFHDMGLIWGLLLPLYAGFPVTFMNPVSFLQRPARWLEAVSRFAGTNICAPNFGYELCVKKLDERAAEKLDLSTLDVAANAAEPIRVSTLEAFATRFARSGFRKEALCPSYGLAEATLPVSLSTPDSEPTVLPISTEALGQFRVEMGREGDVTRAIGCGRAVDHVEIAIVDPETRARLPEDRVGEIWARGPVIAQRYWQRPEATQETFAARIRDEDQRDWLRTGDLGFVRDGEVFIVGRIKDVIVVRGRNVYPHDVEQVAEEAHPAVRPGCAAASPVVADGEERVALVAEADPGKLGADESEDLLRQIRATVAEALDVSLAAVVLVPPRTVFKTTSGKIQRKKTWKAAEAGELEIVVEDRAPREDAAPAASPPRSGSERRALEEQVWEIVRAQAGRSLPRRVQRDTPFSELGLDSVAAVGVSGELSERLGRTLPPTLLFDHPTVASLCAHLAGARAGRGAPARRRAEDEPVAIVSAACRFPGGVRSLGDFWELLRAGQSVAFSRAPPASRDSRADEAPAPVGFIADAESFDAGFFGMSAEEAAHTDPQQRVLLELAWEALERAYRVPRDLMDEAVGVFVGQSSIDWSERALFAGVRDRMTAWSLLGSSHAVAAGRIAYRFGFRGPTLTVDTACSSSLVALHLAARSVRSGECELALAGGVNLILSPIATRILADMGALSPTGLCRAFSADADGYVRAEGGSLVVLERLSDALERGDPILGLVRGTAVGQDGRSNGLTVPSGPAQADILRSALTDAAVDPADVDALECHGTGTPLGDPIEVKAVGDVYGEGRPADRPPLAIGSVKAHIGHTEAAAGIAGVLKALAALEHDELPPSLHAERLNPHVPWSDLPLRVTTEPTPWPRGDSLRRVGVSSFGLSGTNAHVILEEAPPGARARAEPRDGDVTRPLSRAEAGAERVPILLSARTAGALREQARLLRRHLASAPSQDLADIAFSLATTRTHFAHRAFIMARPDRRDELFAALDSLAEGNPDDRVETAVAGEGGGDLCVSFPGQGIAWRGMGRALYRFFPTFRAAVAEIDQHLPLESPIASLLSPEREPGDDALADTDTAQPALFALQVALFRLVREFGLEPDALIGHSVGEIAAAHASGVLPLADACQLVAARGRLMQSLGAGAMASIRAPEAEIRSALAGVEDRVDIACRNAPESIVISGDEAAVTELAQTLRERGRKVDVLPVRRGFHSPHMDALVPELREVAARLRYKAPRIPVVSTVTGADVEAERIATPAYWAEQARACVNFEAGIRALIEKDARTYLEIGPGATLSALTQSCLDAAGAGGPRALPLLPSPDAELGALFEAMAVLHLGGHEVAWQRVLAPLGAHRVPLPTYPFERERHWLEVPGEAPTPPADVPSGPARTAGSPPPVTDIAARLRHRLADALSVPVADVPEGASLGDLGIDSVTALSLSRKLGATWGITIPADSIWHHPDIASLARHIRGLMTGGEAPGVGGADESHRARAARASAASDPGAADTWFRLHRPASGAAMRLFCFPYSGGNAALFRDWPPRLPPSVEVRALELPGRASRSHEPPLRSFARMLEAVKAQIEPLLDLPFAFFGHSLGGYIAFELARALRDQGAPLPRRLLLAGTRAPQLPPADWVVDPIHTLPSEAFWRELGRLEGTPKEVLHSPVLREMSEPVLRADVELFDTWRYRPGEPLDVPISLYAGDEDTFVERRHLVGYGLMNLGWQMHTTASVNLTSLPGDHFFIHQSQDELIRAVAEKIAPAATGAPVADTPAAQPVARVPAPTSS